MELLIITAKYFPKFIQLYLSYFWARLTFKKKALLDAEQQQQLALQLAEISECVAEAMVDRLSFELGIPTAPEYIFREMNEKRFEIEQDMLSRLPAALGKLAIAFEKLGKEWTPKLKGPATKLQLFWFEKQLTEAAERIYNQDLAPHMSTL